MYMFYYLLSRQRLETQLSTQVTIWIMQLKDAPQKDEIIGRWTSSPDPCSAYSTIMVS